MNLWNGHFNTIQNIPIRIMAIISWNIVQLNRIYQMRCKTVSLESKKYRTNKTKHKMSIKEMERESV